MKLKNPAGLLIKLASSINLSIFPSWLRIRSHWMAGESPWKSSWNLPLNALETYGIFLKNFIRNLSSFAQKKNERFTDLFLKSLTHRVSKQAPRDRLAPFLSAAYTCSRTTKLLHLEQPQIQRSLGVSCASARSGLEPIWVVFVDQSSIVLGFHSETQETKYKRWEF